MEVQPKYTQGPLLKQVLYLFEIKLAETLKCEQHNWPDASHVVYQIIYTSYIYDSMLYLFTGRIEHGFNVRPDLCATQNSHGPRIYLGRIWSDSLVHDTDALKHLTKVLGKVNCHIKRTIN